MRTAIAELTSHSGEVATGISGLSNPVPVDIEQPRGEELPVQSLKAEIAQLRHELAEMKAALQARIEKLDAQISAVQASDDESPDAGSVGSKERAAKLQTVISQAATLAKSSPEKAAQWVASLPPGEEQNEAALTVVGQWLASDPAAAATWTAQFAEGSLRERAMTRVARNWGLRDWGAAAGWLDTLPMGASRDAAIDAFVTSADGYDIQLALEWANRIEGPQSRAARVEQTARRWLEENQAAARAWLEKAQLPSGMLERLLPAK